MTQMTPEQQQELQEKIKKMSPEELKEFQKQQCIFCQIIAGKVPSKKVYEDKHSYAVLDINPASRGHILLLPKEHYSIMPQMPDNILAHLYVVAKHLSQTVLRTLKVEGTTIFVANGLAAGQKAQHFMIHIIPRKEHDNLLTVEEKVVGSDLKQKVAQALQNQLNAQLGVKKETVQLQLPTPKPEPEPEPEEPEPLSAPEPAPEPKSKATKQKKSPPVSAPTKRKSTEDVSLDDIANLFK